MMSSSALTPVLSADHFLIEAQISGIISGLLASTLAYVGFRIIASQSRLLRHRH